jgi:cytoskeletal protein RodZ
MLFKNNKIQEAEETIAEKLRTARQEKNISLTDAAKKLSINPDYLTALENGDYAALPGGVYGKTFLREYSSWLGLNSEHLLEKFQKEKGEADSADKDVFSKKKIKRSELVIFPKILKNIFLLAVAAIFFLYLGYYLMKTFSLPKIEIYQPPDNLVTESNIVDIVGRADAKTQITINGIQTLKDGAGNFTKRIDLKKGINIIIISGQNKYSRQKNIQKQVLAK